VPGLNAAVWRRLEDSRMPHAAFTPKNVEYIRNVLLVQVYSPDCIGFIRASGVAYLRGFTPWKPLSFPPSAMEEITTIYTC